MKICCLLILVSSFSAFARPKITDMSVSANGQYSEGDAVNYIATFSEAVTVTGSPRIYLNVGEDRRRANYVSGSGTEMLVFSYVVQSGDADDDGIEDYGMISQPDGLIRSARTNQAASVIYPGPYIRDVLIISAE